MNSTPAERRAAPAVCQQMLTFTLGNEVYGVDILSVQEIRGWSSVTKIPHAPQDVLGVIHLRGSVVPIVDLRLRFALGGAEYNATTVIIVLTLASVAGTAEVGVVVDSVKEVVDVDASRLRPPPDLGGRQATEYISGLLPGADQMVVLLDVDRLVGNAIPESVRAA
jgi:purine-binding chemotaxis protein CheW